MSVYTERQAVQRRLEMARAAASRLTKDWAVVGPYAAVQPDSDGGAFVEVTLYITPEEIARQEQEAR